MVWDVPGKPVIFSGMQATGMLHLGHYVGAMRHWARLQREYNCLYCVVDMHSITVRQEPEALRRQARTLLTLYVAFGLDPDASVLYYQSHVPAHAELAWVLGCYTQVGELNRMTQFKDKSAKHPGNVNAGLYTYPVLMAADILLYNANLVPVGEDQKQHLELCRDVAQRFNGVYGEVFTVPEAYIAEVGARVMGLQEPSRKMSKSDAANENNLIYLLDPPDVIMKKCKRAVTDSLGEVRYSPEQPGVGNLLSIYAALTGRGVAECEAEFAGAGYGALKTRVGEAISESLAPFQRRYAELSADAAYIDAVIKRGAERANALAAETLTKVKQAVGFPI
jgi:tryptophanyl-tRNA synthetase